LYSAWEERGYTGSGMSGSLDDLGILVGMGRERAHGCPCCIKGWDLEDFRSTGSTVGFYS